MFKFKNCLTALGLIFYSLSITAQQKYTISGYIKDGKNGEDLIGATVFIKETNSATSTNAYGYYSLTLPEGKYTVSYQFIGYVTVIKEVDLTSNQKLDIEIAEEKVELQEVVVNAERPDANVRSNEMSVNKLDIKQINKIPALLGEVDVIRSIQLLPGVSTVGEGASGFNVRGGSIDQNLVLLDEAPVYNSSHLFGLFSVFNPDAVKDVKLYKGGIPAQYGGRLSSILDVRLKEGNSKRLAVQGGVGVIFSRLTIEAPIKKDKGSFIIAGRRSYIDAFIAPFLSSNPDFKGFRLYYYDLTFKANYSLGLKDKIFASGYLGRDVFGVSAFGFNWGNSTFSLRWNHLFNEKLFMNLTGFYSNYDYFLGAETNAGGDGFSRKSNIINYSIKPDFTWYLGSRNTINFGGQLIYYTFIPSRTEIRSGGVQSISDAPYKYTTESAIYAASEQTFTPRFSITYGLRLSMLQYWGPGLVNTYDYSGPGEIVKPLISSQNYGSGQVVQQYINPEPRFSFKYELSEKSSLKGSYMRTAQYIQLISNTAASIPLDIWTPSSNNIKPQLADQVALGYFRNFGDNNYETSVEGFYKVYQNQVDYIDGADLFRPEVENQLTFGKGRAFGAEFYVKKNSGQLTGWLSYTLARTERQTPGINNDDWYPTRFDKTHNLSLVINYQVKNKVLFFNDRWSFATNVSYGSGTPVNLFTERGYYGPYLIGNNASNARNNLRIPDYFRIDVSATLKSKKRIKNTDTDQSGFKSFLARYEWDLVFGVYNILGRRNAFAIYPRQDAEVSTNAELVRFSLLAFPVPSITYNFRF